MNEELPADVAAQVSEAAASVTAEPVKLKTKTVIVAGEPWQIPTEVSVGYLYDLSRAEDDDDMSNMRAMMDATRTLLGDKQFVRFRLLGAGAVDELHEAAQKAYGMEGNSDASPGS